MSAEELPAALAALYREAMREAITEAEKGRFTACPNPTVGAVLIRDGNIVARGYHHKAGQPHAEIMCLRDAQEKGIDPKGCTIAVTLEPCNHTGRTGPCSEALIRAGVKRVVIGMRDPNPKAAGGAERLRMAGVEVIENVLEEECRDLAADFVTWTVKKRPFVILKLASTLDGRIATSCGQSRWVTGETARSAVHGLRRGVGLAGGAVLVGGRTFREDDPELTARPADEDTKQPLACVLTSCLPDPGDNFHLLRERPEQTLFFTGRDESVSPGADALRDLGVRVIGMEGENGALDLQGMLNALWELGCPYVLCEGGGSMGLSLVEQGLCDLFLLHMAPKILGDAKARPLFSGRSPETMEDAIGMRLAGVRRLGDDLELRLFPRGGEK